MTNLDQLLASIRDAGNNRLEILSMEAEAVVLDTRRKLKEAVAQNGRKWCDLCDGTGAIERLDSGYMKKFGLSEWNGCPDCGGEGWSKKGRGYL